MQHDFALLRLEINIDRPKYLPLYTGKSDPEERARAIGCALDLGGKKERVIELNYYEHEGPIKELDH